MHKAWSGTNFWPAWVEASKPCMHQDQGGVTGWSRHRPTPGLCQRSNLLLPDARYLFIHRDGRQVAESMMSLWQWSFRKAVKTWREANQCALSFESEQAGKVLRISFESLIRDPAVVLAAAWRFLYLEECQKSIQFITSNPAHQYLAGLRRSDRYAKTGAQVSWLVKVSNRVVPKNSRCKDGTVGLRHLITSAKLKWGVW